MGPANQLEIKEIFAKVTAIISGNTPPQVRGKRNSSSPTILRGRWMTTMMQKLYFEPAWDKTIAPTDREKIIQHFQQQIKQLQNGVHLSFLWNARNHKAEQLITVLIHNFEEINLRLHNTVISYNEQGKQLANATFSLPCEIVGNTSMPWTFIFSDANETNTNTDSEYTIRN